MTATYQPNGMQTIAGERKIDYWYPATAGDSGKAAKLKPYSRVINWRADVKAREVESILRANATWDQRGVTIDYGNYTAACARPDAAMEAALGVALGDMGLDRDEWSLEERSSILRGAGAEFHVDEDFGDPVALFCVVAIAGGGDFVMPNIGVRIPFVRGTAILFDPMELHGITAAGSASAGTAPFICLTRDVQLKLGAARHLGLAGEHRGVRFDSLSLCRTSGELKRKQIAASRRLGH